MRELLPTSLTVSTSPQLNSLNISVRTFSTSVNNDPLSSVKNSANEALNEAKVNRLKSAKGCILPKPLLALCRIALFDDCKE